MLPKLPKNTVHNNDGQHIFKQNLPVVNLLFSRIALPSSQNMRIFSLSSLSPDLHFLWLLKRNAYKIVCFFRVHRMKNTTVRPMNSTVKMYLDTSYYYSRDNCQIQQQSTFWTTQSMKKTKFVRGLVKKNREKKFLASTAR